MKDLIFITAHCPTTEQVERLEKCVESVIKTGHHILLISHTHIPIHIQQKCQYYFYDYLNETSDDYNLFGFSNYTSNDFIIQSKFFQKSFYGFAIYRMFSIASQIAINFGYENIHHIEYDCELIDNKLIDENNKLLQDYDSIIYTDNGNEDGFLFGSFKSFKVSSLPEHFIKYNKDFIESEVKKSNTNALECLTKKLFMERGDVCFQSIPSEQRFKKGINFHNRNLHYTLYYNPLDKTLNIFYNSIIDSSEDIVIIVNKTNIINLTTKPRHWHVRVLGIFDEVTHVRIDNTNKIIYEKTFDPEFREIFKIKSYVTNA
jgi:hypothetical protein